MAEIDFGVPLVARNGSTDLDEVIQDPVPMRKKDGSFYRVCFDGPEHVLSLGPTRSGKSRRLLMPELVHDTDRSMVLVDIKAELAKFSAQHRAKFSEVLVIDPFGELANQGGEAIESAGYNPMLWIDPAADDFVDGATAIAEAICPVENEREPHFDSGAQNIVAGLILYHRWLNPEACLTDIRVDLARTRAGWTDLLLGDDNGQTKEGQPCVFLAADLSGIRPMWEKLAGLADIHPSDRELLGFIRSAQTKTNWLDSPPIRRDLAKPGVDFRALKERQVTVFLVMPPGRLATHSRFLRLVLSGAIEALRKTPAIKGRPAVLVVIDEFIQLGRMQSVETGVQLNAGYGTKFWLIAQNIPDLKKLYSENFDGFVSAGVLTAFGSRDPTTSAYLAKLSGERTIDVLSDSRDAEGRPTVSVSRQRRENVMPHLFEQLGKGRMFVRLPSDKLGVARYITELPDFTERADIPKEVRALGR